MIVKTDFIIIKTCYLILLFVNFVRKYIYVRSHNLPGGGVWMRWEASDISTKLIHSHTTTDIPLPYCQRPGITSTVLLVFYESSHLDFKKPVWRYRIYNWSFKADPHITTDETVTYIRMVAYVTLSVEGFAALLLKERWTCTYL